MIVDAERLVSVFLRNHDDINTIVADRVYTELPSRATFPLLKVAQIAGAPVYSRPLYLDEALLQLDCYGGPKHQARQLLDTARQLIADHLPGTHPLGVVTGVTFGDTTYLPDDAYEPAKPRWVSEVVVYTHP